MPNGGHREMVVQAFRGNLRCFPTIRVRFLEDPHAILLSVTDAGGNKQALSVRGPDQGQEIAPTLHLHLLQYLSVQGKNVDWACHGSSCGNPGTIRRESQSPILVIRNQSESKKLRASAF